MAWSKDYGKSAKASAEEAQAVADNTEHLGDYVNTTTYAPNNIVSYDMSSYMAIQQTLGNIPTDTTYWKLVARRGVDGTGAVSTVNNVAPDLNGNIVLPIIQDASTTVKGIVQLTNATDSASEIMAITPLALKIVAGEVATHKTENATTTSKGHVQVGTNVSVSNGVISVSDASTSDKGVVQLSSSLTSTSTSLAATSNALKSVNDSLTTHLSTNATDTVYGHVRLSDLPKGKKVARFVVGTSTSGWTSADCDYLCDGVDDQAEINATIAALPVNGGEIIVLDGTYNITATITVNKDNVKLRGNGNSTCLKRMWNNAVTEGLINITTNNCRVSDFYIDGNKVAYTNIKNCGISIGANAINNKIKYNTCNNNQYGIYVISSNDNVITGNNCISNVYGINLATSNNNAVANNNCSSNSSRGIFLSSNSNNNDITGNICSSNSHSGITLSVSSNNVTTGNICSSNSTYGIYVSNTSTNNTVTGNTTNNNGNGILLETSCSNNLISSNTCIRGTGLSSDYSATQYTIRLFGTTNNYNLISSNNCMGKDVLIEGGTSNTSVNNKFS